MCGVCGVLNLDGRPVDRNVIASMNQAIAHRGPDGQGDFVDGPIGIGHRRLAIVDLSENGHQPMSVADGRLVVSYNGEIYNHVELRVELESLGHAFRSRSDTEVLLRAWLEWGSACVQRLNGMFAFALWDSSKSELNLVRDRYGIKPIYYALLGTTLVFGSEQRAILQHPGVTRRIDKKALVEYLTFQNIISDRTFNEAIKILPAGHMLRIGRGMNSPELHQYWDFAFKDPSGTVHSEDFEEELEALIRQAVKRQLRSDVEVGSYLSGGLDSGTIAALASQETSNLQTFTCGFDTSGVSPDEALFDERDAARRVANHLGTRHHETVVGPREFESVLKTVVTQLEEPRVGQSYPNYLVAQLAAQNVKVVLSGAGGDELFGGYPWRYAAAYNSPNPRSFIDTYFQYWNRLFQPAELQNLLRPIWREVSDFDVKELFESVLGNQYQVGQSPPEWLNACLRFEAKTFLHGLLVVEDKLSMAHGLETRLPFLDNDLVDFASRCPTWLKVVSDSLSSYRPNVSGTSVESPPLVGKEILRRVQQRVFGKDFVGTRKQGFSAPDSRWFLRNPVIEGMLQNFTRGQVSHEVIDPIAAQLLSKKSPSASSRLQLWSLVSIAIGAVV